MDPLRLIEFGAVVYAALGVPADDARLLATSLVHADLWGHPSHGVMRLPWYPARLKSGVMQAVTQAQTVMDAGAVAVLDGAVGIGQVLAAQATQEAIRRAQLHGISAVAMRRSNHFGTATFFSLMGPPQGCVVMVSTNASPSMAPWGGREKRLGNNPWSLAAPAVRHAPMVTLQRRRLRGFIEPPFEGTLRSRDSSVRSEAGLMLSAMKMSIKTHLKALSLALDCCICC